MFFRIFFFEIRYRLKRPATYIYFGLFFAFAFILTLAAGGAFASNPLSIGNAGGKIFINSPFFITIYTYILDYLGIIIIAALIAGPVYRDFQYRTHSLFFTKPLSKWDYLGGRFLGSCFIAVFVLSGIALGLMFGSIMPFVLPSKVGPFHLLSYLQPYLTIVVPNLLFMGMIFFMLATLTRNMLPVYITSIVLLIFLGIAGQLVKTLSNEHIAALLDPVGGRALGYLTKYWTVAQKNTQPILLSGMLLFNRLLWLGVATALFAVLFKKFKFDQFSSERKVKSRAVTGKVATHILTSVTAHPDFSFSSQMKQFWRMAKLESKNVIISPYFIAIAVAGMLFMFVAGSQFGKIYDTNTYPVTGTMIQGLLGTFSLFIIIIIVFYSGEMLWKERELKMNQIYDALPLPEWAGFASKLTALIAIQVLLLLLIMACGIIIQIFYGYYHFQIPLYIESLFGIRLIGFVLMCIMALFIQIVVNQKYLGFFVVIAYYLFTIFFMDSLGLQHNLYKYGAQSGMPYSAMNGYGHYWKGFLWFSFYWVCFAVMLSVISRMFWVRGITEGFKSRLHTAALRFKGNTRNVFFIALLLFVGSGTYIFYNTNILNHYTTEYEQEKQQVVYELKYKKYENIPQPRIIAMNVHADIYPYKRALHFKCSYILKNKTNKPIDSIHVLLNNNVRKNIIRFSDYPSIRAAGNNGVIISFAYKAPQPIHALLVSNDSLNGYYIYRLPTPLMPHDSLRMDFELQYAARGFSNSGSNDGANGIYYNGTFVTNAQFFPHIGYDPDGELTDNTERKRFNLPYRPPLASLSDTNALKNNLISNDADWVRYTAILSTSADQTALTSGDLVKSWTQNNRNYFKYKCDSKILCFVPFVSARYKVKQGQWHNISLKIYYHKGHEYNLNRMMAALKDGLTYYTKYYGPYQFKEVKIMEFPYASFAESFANTIPFSENVGFIADVNDSNPQDVDYPYYVTAHELSHQWWGHQVIGANVQGVTMLDETMAQYSALMIMKHRFGPDKMKKFLKYEMDMYLRGRSVEKEQEEPLYKVEGQQYIHYRKGSVVMYALQDYIGEYRLDSALHVFLKKTKFKGPPYPTTLDWLHYVSVVVPDSLKYIIHDMFKAITLYNNKVTEATWKKESDSTYVVHLTVEAHKLTSDSAGNQKEDSLHDWIDIGIFGVPEKGGLKPMYLHKVKITSIHTNINIVVKGSKPYEAGIDPYNKLIDLNPDDNIMVLSKAIK